MFIPRLSQTGLFNMLLLIEHVYQGYVGEFCQLRMKSWSCVYPRFVDRITCAHWRGFYLNKNRSFEAAI